MPTEFRAVVIQNDEGLPDGIHRHSVLISIVTTEEILPHPDRSHPLIVDSHGDQQIGALLVAALSDPTAWYKHVGKSDLRLMTTSEIFRQMGRLELLPWRPE